MKMVRCGIFIQIVTPDIKVTEHLQTDEEKILAYVRPAGALTWW